MILCTFSKSETHASEILCDCPLALTSTLAKRCPCRKRLYVDDLRLLSCTHPTLWNGEMIRDSEALVANLKRKHETEKENRRLERKIDMSTTTAAPKKSAANGQVTAPAASAASNGLATAGASANAANAPQKHDTTALSLLLGAPSPSALAFYKKIADPMDAVNKLGKVFSTSGMFGCANDDQGRVLAMICLTEGKTPSQILKRHHIIGGKLSDKADAMLAAFRMSGGRHLIKQYTPEVVEIEFSTPDQKFTAKFTLAEALEEDYIYTKEAVAGKVAKRNADGSLNRWALKDNWSTPRRRAQMMWARVISDTVRHLMPEVNFGEYTADELGGTEDFTEDVYVDAEFEVVAEQSKPAEAVQAERPRTAETTEAAAEAAGGASDKGNGGEGVAAAEVFTESAVADMTQEAAPFVADEKPEAKPGTPEAQLQTPPNANADAEAIIDMPRLLELKKLKDAIGYTPEDWTGRVLAKFKVPTAKQLTRGQADALILALGNKLKQSTGKDALSQWAENAGKN